MEPVWLKLGASAVSLLLRFVAFQNEPEAQTLADLTDAGASFVSRVFSGSRRGREAFEEKVAKKLVDRAMARTELSQALKSDHFEIAGVITEVEIVLDGFDCNRQMLVDIAAKPEDFKRELHSQGTARKRRVSEAAEALFDALLDVVAAELSEQARKTEGFEINALISLLNKLGIIGEKIDLTHRTLEKGLDAIADQHIITNERLGSIEEQLERFTPAAQRPKCVRYGSRVALTQNFVERSVAQDLVREVFTDDASGMWALKGMPGCGKSQIASYLTNWAEDADWPVIVWQVASSREAMLSMYRALAVQVLPDVQEQDDEVLARMVLGALSSDDRWHRQLFVFDNVESADHLHDLIPSPPRATVIITTTGTVPATARAIAIDVFTTQESREYLRKQLPATTIESCDSLATAMDHLPLALTQASASIARRSKAVEEYLSELRRYPIDRLLLREEGSLYGETVVRALIEPIETLVRSLQGTLRQCVIDQLSALSFLGPSGVKRSWLEVLGTDEIEGAECVSLLVSISIFRQSSDGDIVELHRLQSRILRENFLPVLIPTPPQRIRAAVEVVTQAIEHIKDSADGTIEAHQDEYYILRKEHKFGLYHLRFVHDQSKLLGASCDANVIYLIQLALSTCIDLHLYLEACSLESCFNHLPLEIRIESLPAENLAIALLFTGRFRQVESLCRSTLARLQNSVSADQYELLRLQRYLAMSLIGMQKYQEAMEVYSEVFSEANRLHGAAAEFTIACRNDMGTISIARKSYNEAIAYFRENLHVVESLHGFSSFLAIEYRDNLVYALRSAGRIDDAIAIYERALNQLCEELEDTDLRILSTRVNLAVSYDLSGQKDRALRLLREKLPLHAMALGHDNVKVLGSYIQLARINKNVGNYDEALRILTDVQERSLIRFESNSPLPFSTLREIGDTYFEAKDLDNAIFAYEESLRHLEAILGPYHIEARLSRDGLIKAYEAEGSHEKAIPLLEDKVSYLERERMRDAPSTTEARERLASAYLAAGRSKDAACLMEKTVSDNRSSAADSEDYE